MKDVSDAQKVSKCVIDKCTSASGNVYMKAVRVDAQTVSSGSILHLQTETKLIFGSPPVICELKPWSSCEASVVKIHFLPA